MTVSILTPSALLLPLVGALPLQEPAAPVPDPLPDAVQLLDTAYAKIGGLDAIACMGTLRFKGEATLAGMPGKGRFEELFHPSGRTLMKTSFEGFGETRLGTDGFVFWEHSAMGIDIKRGWRAAAEFRRYGIHRFAPWSVMYAEAEVVGRGKVGELDCWELRMIPKSPKDLGFAPVEDEEAPGPDTWWLAEETGLPARIDMDVVIPTSGPGRLEWSFEDWKSVDGLLFPHRRTVRIHGFTLHFDATSIETSVVVGMESFALPSAVAERAKSKPEITIPDPEWKIVEIAEQHTAIIRAECKMTEISATLASILPEVMRYVLEVEAEMTAPPFTRYVTFGDTLKIEAGIPVKEAIEPKGRIEAGILPGGQAVRGWHVGPYHSLPVTHASLDAWLAEKELTRAGGAWEVYWTDPGLEPDPKKWKTEVVQPVGS